MLKKIFFLISFIKFDNLLAYNLTGQLVLQDTGLDNNHTLDTTKLNNGLYIVVLKINEENKTYKIEVKH